MFSVNHSCSFARAAMAEDHTLQKGSYQRWRLEVRSLLAGGPPLRAVRELPLPASPQLLGVLWHPVTWGHISPLSVCLPLHHAFSSGAACVPVSPFPNDTSYWMRAHPSDSSQLTAAVKSCIQTRSPSEVLGLGFQCMHLGRTLQPVSVCTQYHSKPSLKYLKTAREDEASRY